jgi:hypothetical protein
MIDVYQAWKRSWSVRGSPSVSTMTLYVGMASRHTSGNSSRRSR